MPERLLFPEWRAEHAANKYPFGDRATLTNAEGLVILEGTFVDAALYPVGGGAELYVSLITVTHDAVTIWVGDANQPQLASATFDLIAPPEVISFTDTVGRPAGVMVSEPGQLGIFQSWDVGDHAFTSAQAPLAATVCLPAPELGLRGIVLEDGSFFTGDVWLVGEDGVVLREESTPLVSSDGSTPAPYRIVRVDVVGDPLFRRRLCEPVTLFTTPRFVKKLHVTAGSSSFTVTPSAAGDIQVSVNNSLSAAPALRVRTTASGIVFEALGSAAH